MVYIFNLVSVNLMCFVEVLKCISSILNYSLRTFSNKYSNSFCSYKNKTTKISQNIVSGFNNYYTPPKKKIKEKNLQKDIVATLSLFNQILPLHTWEDIRDAYISRKNIDNFCDKGFIPQKIVHVCVHETSLKIYDYYFFHP